MVHGNCVSIGCYAMTDAGIDDIYQLVKSALDNGQKAVPVHIFPFRMTETALDDHQAAQWMDFCKNLKTGYDRFEDDRVPPKVWACGKAYRFSHKKPQRSCRLVSS